MPFLALLGGPFGRICLYAVVVAAIIAGAFFVVHEHDKRILAEQAAIEAATVAAEQLADARKAVAAANAEAAAAVERASRNATIKTEVARAPITVACASSPAILAVISGMRSINGSGGNSTGNTGIPARLPASTGTTKPTP